MAWQSLCRAHRLCGHTELQGARIPRGERDGHWPLAMYQAWTFYLGLTLHDPERRAWRLSSDKLSVSEGHIQDARPVGPQASILSQPLPWLLSLRSDPMTPATVFPVDAGEPEEERSDHQHRRATS